MPQVEAFLLGRNARTLSPAFSIRRRDSTPIHTESVRSSFSQASAAVNDDEDIVSNEDNDNAMPGQEATGPQAREELGICIQKENVHAFLRWADMHKASPYLSNFATIRHANLIAFSFRIREIADIESYYQSGVNQYSHNELSKLLELYQSAVAITRSDIRLLRSYWTGDYSFVASSPGEDIVHASFFYQSYYRQYDWQIVREVNCVVWPSAGIHSEHILNRETAPIHSPQPHVQYHDFFQGLRPLMDMRGNVSTWCALTNYTLIPYLVNLDGENYVLWDIPDSSSVKVSQKTIGACKELIKNDSLFLQSTQLAREHGQSRIRILNPADFAWNLSHILPGLEDMDISDQHDGIITVRPQDWPETCPRFCLSVMAANALDNPSAVPRILEWALTERKFYGHFVKETVLAGLRAWTRDVNSMGSGWNELA